MAKIRRVKDPGFEHKQQTSPQDEIKYYPDLFWQFSLSSAVIAACTTCHTKYASLLGPELPPGQDGASPDVPFRCNICDMTPVDRQQPARPQLEEEDFLWMNPRARRLVGLP